MTTVRRYRIRSRVVPSCRFRVFFVQRFEGYVDGRESWTIVARSYHKQQAEAYVSQALAGSCPAAKEPQ